MLVGRSLVTAIYSLKVMWGNKIGLDREKAPIDGCGELRSVGINKLPNLPAHLVPQAGML
jgi:hypothetical protein